MKFFPCIIFCVLLLAACQPEKKNIPTIRLGYSSHDHHSALFIAALLPDYFREQGGVYLQQIEYKNHYLLKADDEVLAEVILYNSSGGGQLIQKLHEMQIDMALGGVPAMLNFINKGGKLKIIAPLMSEGAALVVDKKIEADSWQTLVKRIKSSEKPLRIGYKTEISVQNLIFENALETENIQYTKGQLQEDTQVVLRNLHGTKNILPAMKNGLIDGFVIMQPYAALAEFEGLGKIIAQLQDLPPGKKWQGYPCCALAANGPLLTDQREVLIKITALLLRATQYLLDQPEESAKLVSRWLEQALEVEQHSLPTISFQIDYQSGWHSGVANWLLRMEELGRLQGLLQETGQNGDLSEKLYDNEIYRRARAELR